MSEQFNFPEFEIDLSEDAIPRVPIEDVLAIQALSMGRVRDVSHTRTRRDNARVHSFMLLHQTTPYVERAEDLIVASDSEDSEVSEVDFDTYLGVIAREPSPRSWKLTVSFLQNILDERHRYSSTREMYQFEWERGDNEVIGMYKIIDIEGKATSRHTVDADNAMTFEADVKSARRVSRYAMTSLDCLELQNKMNRYLDIYLEPPLMASSH